MRATAGLSVLLAITFGLFSSCGGTSDRSDPDVLDCASVRLQATTLVATPTSGPIALFPTFEGVKAAEAKLGWKPLGSDGARFEIELWNSSVDGNSRGSHTIRMSYLETATGEGVTLIQGDACSLVDGDKRTPVGATSGRQEPIGGFVTYAWQVPVTNGTWIIEFETGEEIDDNPIFATVLATELERAEAFIETLR